MNISANNSDSIHLPEETAKLFNSFGTEKQYPKNTPLYFQGEQAECFYYLKKGNVKVFCTSIDGLQQTLSIVGSGNILGEAAFFDKMPRVSSAQTISPCVIVSITHKQIEDAFAQSPKLAMYLLQVQAHSIRMLSSQMSGMVFTKADCRIANQLLKSQTSLNGKIIVNLTHEEIGNLVGVSRVTVSKILKEFANKNIIETAYRYIVISDIEKLQKITSAQ
ncbi:MAG: Crp/Fnr family transcriptional regulator [Acutalibacteraceae bacterium]|nr:Crp/Fnr family transcriptional regulator [Acutalibacteraceae bacterium]